MYLIEQVEGKDRQIKKLRREVRRVRQEAEMAVNEMQPQLRNLVDVLQESKVGWMIAVMVTVMVMLIMTITFMLIV